MNKRRQKYKKTTNYKNIIIKILKKLLIFIIICLSVFLILIGFKYYIDFIEKKRIEIKNERIQKELEYKKEQIEIEKKKKKEAYLNYIKHLDLEIDSSITKYVNNKINYNDEFYAPKNLVLVEGKHIIDSQLGIIKVRKIVKENLVKLAEDFFKETNNNIVIVSGYRAYSYQQKMNEKNCPPLFCAKAGHSEHQSGLAIDIYSSDSKRNWTNDNNLKEYYYWFDKNSYKYGFINSYKKGAKIDGYGPEPWHWRYVGKRLAKYLYDHDMSFAEFYKKRVEDNKKGN